MQCLFVVTIQNLDGPLGQNRPRINSGVHQMDGTAGDLDSVLERLRHCVGTGERRQQRGMSVYHAAGKPLKKFRAKDFHETC